ncbi:hypothetical protein Nepgr_006698 [Nepenthes gracilis]|uniref:Uncharacterized protein n=1 Tax=Nepenthes gracilis TaxID=150966 RepID=A0AAD3XHL3_NEPGR|nr:hypothetical protein Nepgr_006698 [Nepenthes gracilis]
MAMLPLFPIYSRTRPDGQRFFIPPGSAQIPSSIESESHRHSIADEMVPSALDAESDGVSWEAVVASLMRSLPADIAGVDSEAISPIDGLPSGYLMEGSFCEACDATFEVGIKEPHQPSLSSDLASDQKLSHQINIPFNHTEGSPVAESLHSNDVGCGKVQAMPDVDPDADRVSPAILTLNDAKAVQRCIDIPLPCCSQAARVPEGSPSGDGAAVQGMAHCNPNASPSCHQGTPDFGLMMRVLTLFSADAEVYSLEDPEL